MKYEYVVVGAGIAGLTMAERIANVLNKKVLVIEKRSHIGGNIYDSYNEDGILIHNYGPHIFHTNDKEVYDYLSQFTKWRDFWHRVLTCVDGNMIPMPITLETINQLYNTNFTGEEMEAFLKEMAEDIPEIKTSKDVVLARASSFNLTGCGYSKTLFSSAFGFHFRHKYILRLFFYNLIKFKPLQGQASSKCFFPL